MRYPFTPRFGGVSGQHDSATMRGLNQVSFDLQSNAFTLGLTARTYILNTVKHAQLTGSLISTVVPGVISAVTLAKVKVTMAAIEARHVRSAAVEGGTACDVFSRGRCCGGIYWTAYLKRTIIICTLKCVWR